MRMTKRISIALGVWLLATAPAFASTLFTVAANGLTSTSANVGCPAGSFDCFVSRDFQLAAPANATGTITLNSAATIATISLDIASVTFASVPGGGASDVFTNVHYQGAVSVAGSSTNFSQNVAPGPGSVSGFLNGTPFTSSSAIVNLSCFVVGSGQCGLAFGPQAFAVDGHNWLHTFDMFVTATPIPEPSAILLVLLGAAGLTLRRR
jgi:hypothetical protein